MQKSEIRLNDDSCERWMTMPNSSVCDTRNQGVRYRLGDSCSDSCVESQWYFCCMWNSSQWARHLGMLNSLGTQCSKFGAAPYEPGLCVPPVAFATARWFYALEMVTLRLSTC